MITMKNIVLAILLSTLSTQAADTLSKPPALDYVFECGADGHKSYRIPPIIKTTKGTLLAEFLTTSCVAG